jgi:DNA-binding NtrC family response regulator
LRERAAEIPALAEMLLTQLGRKYQRTPPRLRPEDCLPLQQYCFQGNARELRNLLERSLLRTPPEAAWLALDLTWLTTPLPAISQALPAAPQGSPATPPLPAGRELTPVELAEYQLIRQTLIQEAGGIRRAAGKLGMTHQALLRRLQKWPELRPSESPGPRGAQGPNVQEPERH